MTEVMTDTGSGAQCVVLVGYDDSPAGTAALRTGTDLARRLGARVEVVHAVPQLLPAAPTALMSDGFVLPTADDVTASCDQLRDELSGRLRPDLDAAGVEWELQVIAGDAVTVLEEQAEQADAYLVVVGTRHAGLGTALDRLLTGSTSRGLQRRSHRPVLVVPEPH